MLRIAMFAAATETVLGVSLIVWALAMRFQRTRKPAMREVPEGSRTFDQRILLIGIWLAVTGFLLLGLLPATQPGRSM